MMAFSRTVTETALRVTELRIRVAYRHRTPAPVAEADLAPTDIYDKWGCLDEIKVTHVGHAFHFYYSRDIRYN